jgi:hypothetical protein
MNTKDNNMDLQTYLGADIFSRLASLVMLGIEDGTVSDDDWFRTYTAARTIIGLAKEKGENVSEQALLYRFLSALGVQAEGAPQLIQDLLQCLWHEDLSFGGEKMTHGVYIHYKGGRYRSIGVAIDAETGGQRVQYVSMGDGVIYSRLAIEWGQVVRWPDGRFRSRFMPAHRVATS